MLTLVSALAVLNVITGIQRIVHVYRITREAGPEAPRRATPALADPVGRGGRGT